MPNPTTAEPRAIDLSAADFEALLTRALCRAVNLGVFRNKEESLSEWDFGLAPTTPEMHEVMLDEWHQLIKTGKIENSESPAETQRPGKL